MKTLPTYPVMRNGSDALLTVLLILVPVFGGAVNSRLLPLWGLIVCVGLGLSMSESRGKRSTRIQQSTFALALITLAGITLFQAIPLPAALVSVLSPRATELRAFVGMSSAKLPLTYELAATLREGSKFLLYALIAIWVFQRTRTRSRKDKDQPSTRRLHGIAVAVVWACVLSILVGVVHRLIGVNEVFGVMPARNGQLESYTTFVNANHSAGFLVFSALVAFGAALEERQFDRNGLIYFVLGSGFALLALSTGSQGGALALALGIATFVLLGALRGWIRVGVRQTLALFAGLAVGAVALVFWVMPEHALSAKIDAIRGSAPMILDHLWFGIGRGAYVSAYSAYNLSDLQLTFAYPENIVVQSLSEWGILFGGAFLVGFAFLLVQRLRTAKEPVAVGMVVAVGAVLFQNLVDFSLELVGLAIPVVVVLSATAVSKSTDGSKKSWGWVRMGLVTAALGVALTLALVAGDLESDVQSAYASRQLAEVENLAHRHPANAVLAARAAYVAEQYESDLVLALKWANRSLYLSPQYAHAHLLAGRVLVKLGYRAQGFSALRKAWSLSTSAERFSTIEHVIQLAESPQELVAAMPRKDPQSDLLDLTALGRALRSLPAQKKESWGEPLIAYVQPEKYFETELTELVKYATALEAWTQAERVARFQVEAFPESEEAMLTLARVYRLSGQLSKARDVLHAAVSTTGASRHPEILRAKIQLAIIERDLAQATSAVALLRANLSPTRVHQSELLRYQADIARLSDRPLDALEAFDTAVQLTPEDLSLLAERAQLNLQVGRTEAAQRDADKILRLKPHEPSATRIKEQATRASQAAIERRPDLFSPQ